jgi:hypothetical protein
MPLKYSKSGIFVVCHLATLLCRPRANMWRWNTTSLEFYARVLWGTLVKNGEIFLKTFHYGAPYDSDKYKFYRIKAHYVYREYHLNRTTRSSQFVRQSKDLPISTSLQPKGSVHRCPTPFGPLKFGFQNGGHFLSEVYSVRRSVIFVPCCLRSICTIRQAIFTDTFVFYM